MSTTPTPELPIGPSAARPAAPAIRRAMVADAPALLSLSQLAIRSIGPDHHTAGQLDAWAGRRTLAGHVHLIEQTLTVVAGVGERVTGFVSIALRDAHGLVAGEVDQLFVHPDEQGRGVARALLQAAADAARAERLAHLVTHASWRARPAFEAFGFEPLAVETVTIDDQVLRRTLMRLPLEPPSPFGVIRSPP